MTTTSCIVLLDKEEKESAQFFQLSSLGQLEHLDMFNSETAKSHEVTYDQLISQPRWRPMMANEEIVTHDNLVEFSRFAKATRGIATGDNAFFLLSKEQVDELDLKPHEHEAIVSRSADVETAIFTKAAYTRIAKANKKVTFLTPCLPLTFHLVQPSIFTRGFCLVLIKNISAPIESRGIGKKINPPRRFGCHQQAGID